MNDTPPRQGSAVLYGLTAQQRTRIVLTTYLAENTMTIRIISQDTAKVFGVESWVTRLLAAYFGYAAAGTWTDYKLYSLSGLTLHTRTPNGEFAPTLYWPAGENPTKADLYTWALTRAAAARGVLDPAVVRAAESLLCSEAGISSLADLNDEISSQHHLQENPDERLARV